MEPLTKALDAKMSKSYLKLFTLAILCGLIFGACCVAAMGGAVIAPDANGYRIAFSAIFPVGLILVVANGYELFTGDTMLLLYANKKGKTKKVILSLILIYIGNVLGSLIISFVVSHFGIAAKLGIIEKLASLYQAKVSYDILSLIVLGIFCNILVCMAAYLAMCGKTFPEKCIYIVFPIFLFTFLGFEHSVANMTFLPLAIMTNKLAILPALYNLLFVTIGNIIGGFLFGLSVLLKKA